MNVERIKAIATIIVTAAVNIANIYGYAVDADAAVNAVLTIISAVSWVVCWWFNQNITFAAQQGQLVVDKIKNEQRALRAKGRNNA